MNGGTPANGYFPGPLAALGLTVAGIVATTFASLFLIGIFGGEVTVASLGIGEALGLGAVAGLAAQRVASPQRERLGLRGFALGFTPVLVMLLPLVVVLSELDNVIRVLLPPVELPPELEGLKRDLESRSLLRAVETAIVAVGIAPVVEEWLFRGVVLQGLIAHLGKLRGVTLTAALFALVHLGPAPSGPASLSPLVSSFVLGLVLGAVRLASGSVLAPILLSAGIGGLGLAAIATAEILPIEGFNAPGSHSPLRILLPSLFAVCWALAIVLRSAAETPIAPAASDEPDGPAPFTG